MEDTICAISTTLGVGAISIVRVSGSDALEIVNNIFKGKKHESAHLMLSVEIFHRGCLRCLGCYNKMPQIGWPKPHLFPTVLEAEKSKIKVPADSVSMRPLLLVFS